MKIRLEGTPDELDVAVELVKQTFDVREVSRFYSNRGDSKLGRRYVEATAPASPRPVQAHAVRADRVELANGRPELEGR